VRHARDPNELLEILGDELRPVVRADPGPRFAAASGIALVTSIGSLGGLVGPSIVGAAASGPGGIYRGLAIAGVSFFVSATLMVLLPKKARPASKS
jgi:hypothetical protein